MAQICHVVPWLYRRNDHTVDVESGLNLLVVTTSLCSRKGEGFIRSDCEVGPGRPAVEELQYKLSFLEAASNYGGVISKLGPQGPGQAVAPQYAIGLNLKIGKGGHKEIGRAHV